MARLTDLGWGQRVRDAAAARTPPTARPTTRLLAACVEVLAGWDWDAAAGRRRRDAVSLHRPAAGSPRSPGTWPTLGRLTDLGTLR